MAVASMASSLVPPSSQESLRPPTLLTTPFLSLSRRTTFPSRFLRLNAPSRAGSLQLSPLSIRAGSSEETSTESSGQQLDVFADLKVKWDGIENKSTVFMYGGGTLVALWVSSTIVGAINTVPLLPNIMELVGLAYTVWFVNRYLLFKENRKELSTDFEEFKAKITGAGNEE